MKLYAQSGATTITVPLVYLINPPRTVTDGGKLPPYTVRFASNQMTITFDAELAACVEDYVRVED